jgi:hypothetical protein
MEWNFMRRFNKKNSKMKYSTEAKVNNPLIFIPTGSIVPSRSDRY